MADRRQQGPAAARGGEVGESDRAVPWRPARDGGRGARRESRVAGEPRQVREGCTIASGEAIHRKDVGEGCGSCLPVRSAKHHQVATPGNPALQRTTLRLGQGAGVAGPDDGRQPGEWLGPLRQVCG